MAGERSGRGGRGYALVGANNALVSIGPDGYAQRAYDADSDSFGFAQLGLLGNNITGVSPIAASPQSVTGILLSNNTLNQVHRLDPLSGEFGGFASGGLFIDQVTFATNGLSANTVVHVYSPMGDGPILGIGDSAAAGQPGKLWWHDPGSSTSITTVGDLGEGPRRLDCLEPAGTPCAVSSFVAGEVTLVDWPNRNAPPTIGATTVPVAGPVGIDLAMVGGSPTVAATGFNDDTLHLITIGPGLAPTDQEVPLNNCTQPGHATFVPDGSHVVVTCNGSDNFVVLELPIQN